MKVIKFEKDKLPFVKEIGEELEDLQAEVGGNIQVVFVEDFVVVCDEEGMYNHTEPTAQIGPHVLYGPFFLCGLADADFTSLTEEQIERFFSYTPK